ncbi:DUF7518 family protein [Halorubrum vacuolatum]|uniref:BZIP transcription factor n=1 Tax=Halorubrum vacuolatum TaxID=63740 RepID=A0A238VNV3_HALVU|nr:hypothetical protein [Halorubrum vacuolatum]SNR35898.1 hypothetical protein SAMN06264855_103191 [Halorubrum vacuolatum]
MSNRVEDLERQVAELQAAVNGLTEELVEMKERVRQLEADRDAEAERRAAARRAAEADATEPTPPELSERTTHSDDHVDVVKRREGPDATESGEDVTTEDQSATEDGMVVPEDATETADAEADKPEEKGGSTETDESGDSDIIVA